MAPKKPAAHGMQSAGSELPLVNEAVPGDGTARQETVTSQVCLMISVTGMQHRYPRTGPLKAQSSRTRMEGVSLEAVVTCCSLGAGTSIKFNAGSQQTWLVRFAALGCFVTCARRGAARTGRARRWLRRAGGVDVRPRRRGGAGRRAVLRAEGPRRAGHARPVRGGAGRACAKSTVQLGTRSIPGTVVLSQQVQIHVWVEADTT